MGRPKQFDREQVLQRAMELFWAKGYAATSMSDLVETLGVGRQSLYDSFGDKHELFLQALDTYRAQFGSGWRKLLSAERPVRGSLRDLLTATIDFALSIGGRTCMLVNAASELCPEDDDVRGRLCHDVAALEDALTERLDRARRDGEIGAHHDARATARYLVNSLHGLQLTAKIVRDRAALMQIADVTLAVLG